MAASLGPISLLLLMDLLASRGLIQGDLVSPFLFTLVVNSRSQIIINAKSKRFVTASLWGVTGVMFLTFSMRMTP